MAEIKRCPRCKCEVTGNWAEDHNYCRNCDWKVTREIRSFKKSEDSRMRFEVGHSMKGTPRKQAWGMHLINPYKGK